jgi:hypothetical protein
MYELTMTMQYNIRMREMGSRNGDESRVLILATSNYMCLFSGISASDKITSMFNLKTVAQ